MINLSPEQQKQRLDEYRQKIKQLENEQQLIQAERERLKREWENKKLNLPTQNCRTPKTCYQCGVTIPANTQRKVATKILGYQGDWVARRVHYCNKCRPLEAQA